MLYVLRFCENCDVDLPSKHPRSRYYTDFLHQFGNYAIVDAALEGYHQDIQLKIGKNTD
jgi:hypothetical protein